MSSITPIGSLVPYGGPILRHEILANSTTTTVSDALKYASGFVTTASTTGGILGHSTGLSQNKGVGLQSTGAAGAAFGSYIGTYTTASNNQTVAMVRAEIDISQFTLYTATTNGTLGTTTGSNLLGYRFNLAAANNLDETSATTSLAQYQSFGVDPVTSTQVIVNLMKSLVFNT